MTNSSQYLIDILKQKFEHEVARRNEFDNALSLPIALLSFIIPGIYFAVKEVNKDYSQFMKYFLVLYTSTLIISTVWTIHRLYRFYFIGTQYQSLPSSDVIIDVYDTSKVIDDVVSDNLNSRPDDLYIVSELDKFLIKSYKECTAINGAINDKREVLFQTAKKSLAFTFAFAVLFFLILLVIRFLVTFTFP